MNICSIIRTTAVGLALTLGLSTAHAAQVYYQTGVGTLAAPGTIASGGTLTGGGLCAFGTTGCNGTFPGRTPGALTGGGISVVNPGQSALANYQLTFTILGQGTSSLGSIWDITVISGSAVQSLGITNIVSSSVTGSGYVSAVIAGNGTFIIGITDLLDQYAVGATDTLPGFLGSPGLNGGSVGPTTFSTFSLVTTIFSAPEPASMSLLVGGLVALGASRRRRSR